jgi:hypothetical protein
MLGPLRQWVPVHVSHMQGYPSHLFVCDFVWYFRFVCPFSLLGSYCHGLYRIFAFVGDLPTATRVRNPWVNMSNWSQLDLSARTRVASGECE